MTEKLSDWINKKINVSRHSILHIFFVLLFLIIWQLAILPYTKQINNDFSYSAELISSEQAYDESKQNYANETKMEGRLTYQVESEKDGVLLINKDYKILDKDGNITSEISNLYGIDKKTGAHVFDYGDKSREGFLFAQRPLNEDNYLFWDIIYDEPVTMQFLSKEYLSGLTTYHYSSHTRLDQEANCSCTDIELNIWIEPTTNQLIKYSDRSIVYSYDLDSGVRLSPIKRTSNEFTLGFIAKEIDNAESIAMRIYLGNTVTPIFLCIIFFLAIRAALQKRGKSWKYSAYFLSISIFIFLIGSTFFLWRFTSSTISNQTNSKFQTEATSIENTILKRLEVYVNALQGARGLFAASVDVTADEWDKYANTVKINYYYPGVEGIGYRNLDNTISYKNIFDENDLNLFDESIYLNGTDTMDEARDSGNTTMSKKIIFANDAYQAPKTGFLLIAPVYKNGASTKTIEERRNAIQGFVYAPFVMEDFIHSLLYDILLNQKYNIDFEIYSGSSEEKDELFEGTTSISNVNPEYYKKDIVDIYGKEWTILFTSLPGYSGSPLDAILPATIIIIGVLLATLVSSSIYTLQSNKNRAEQIVRVMTKDLKIEKKHILTDKAKDEALLSGIADGVIALNKKGEILFVNKAMSKMLGEEVANLLGKKMIKAIKMSHEKGDLIPDQDRPLYKAFSTKKIIEGHINEDHYFQRKDGSHFPVAYTISPVFLAKKMIGIIGVYRDVTKEREVDKEKTEFVSLASHQLRTPLTAVKWYTESLLHEDNGALNKSQKKQLRQIEIGNQRMVDLVNNLLEVSRLELGTFATAKTKTNISILAVEELKAFHTILRKKNIKFKIHIKKNIPLIYADPKHIEIIFQNLLSNAIQYTPKNGKISFKLSIKKDGKMIQLKISDTGCGIPKKEHKKIFTKLFRADNARDVVPDGTGLGLYIVKSILEKMKGEISFTSEENKGTTFYVEIPLNHPAHKVGKRT